MDEQEKQARVTTLLQKTEQVKTKGNAYHRSLPAGFAEGKTEREYAKGNPDIFRPGFAPSLYCARQSSIFSLHTHTYNTYTVMATAYRREGLDIYFSRSGGTTPRVKECKLAWFVEHIGIDSAEVFEFFEQALLDIDKEIGERFWREVRTLPGKAQIVSERLFKALFEKAELTENLATLQGAVQTAISQLKSTQAAFKSKRVQQVREGLEQALQESGTEKTKA